MTTDEAKQVDDVLVQVPAEHKMGCGSCRWWAKSDLVPGRGWCHRHPPTVRQAGLGFMFPETGEEDWCGEWRVVL